LLLERVTEVPGTCEKSVCPSAEDHRKALLF
jgi:hypothetical protein